MLRNTALSVYNESDQRIGKRGWERGQRQYSHYVGSFDEVNPILKIAATWTARVTI